MATQDFKRKLAAILHADVKGYSRLMGEDEKATVSTLTAYREVMGVLIQQHRGRVVHGTGDSLLAEFISVVDAVQCAVEIQKELKTRNAELSEDRKVEFRFGINLGDVIDKDEDLHGDGVNIAARVEALADGGGICITRSAYDHVKSKLDFGYEYLGEHTVKNIAEPVRVYRVLMEPEAAGKVIGEKRFLGRISRKVAISAIIILAIFAGGLIGWNIYLQKSKDREAAFANAKRQAVENGLKQKEKKIITGSAFNIEVPLTVKVWTPKKNYKAGENIVIYIQGNRDYYARIIDISSRGEIIQLLPNDYRAINFFEAGKVYKIPDKGDQFNLKVTPPYGEDQIVVYASEVPLGTVSMEPAGHGLRSFKGTLKSLAAKTRGVAIVPEAQNVSSGAQFFEGSWTFRTGK